MPIDEVTQTQEAIIYNLPKTALLIDVEVQKTTTFKGPFAQYTDLYFQSNNTVMQNKTFYKLKKINITTFPVQDPKQFYAIIPTSKNEAGTFISLTKDQYPVGIRTFEMYPEGNFNETIEIQNIDTLTPDYADLSIKSVRETIYDTIYTEVLKDSVIIKVPKIYQHKEFKTPKKQAKEVAEQIFQLRDDRLALLKGMNDANNFPDGKAITLMITELNKYERQYMTMFVGQTQSTTERYKFVSIPDESSTTHSDTLFRFSQKFGILPKKLNKGKAVVINLSKKDQTMEAEKYLDYIKSKRLNENKKASSAFAYRIPGKAKINLNMGNKQILTKNIIITQYGKINHLPTKILNDPKLEIIFNPELGSLKKITPIIPHPLMH